MADSNASRDIPDGSETKKGLHLAAEREAKVDDYPERPYSEAMTAEQKATLEAEGLLR